MSTRHDEVRDYGFADKALALRERAGLTQDQLAALLGVSARAIQTWEAGLSYPAAERLRLLVALYLARGAFGAGREEAEAAALWESVRGRAPRRTTPFDPRWFAALPRAGDAAVARTLPPSSPTAPTVPTPSPRRHDWGEAPAAPVIQGRAGELARLTGWARSGGCRVVQILGAGGIGKTTLAVQLAHDLAPEFAGVYWRSLRNAPPAEEWLAGAIAALSAGQAAVPAGVDAQVGLLVDLLGTQRALLVLDNLEAVLEPGHPTVRYRAGHEGYGAVLWRLAQSAHAGCVLLTSREQPLPAGDVAVRTLRLQGLGVDAARALLGSRPLQGDDAAWRALVEHYAGNPLALNVVGETIGAVFGGEIAAFLGQETAVFGGIRRLLDEQVGRLSALERAVLTVLAVAREPVGFAEIVADLGPAVLRGDAVEAVEALRRRSLLEWGAGGAFTLQPVALEYMTARLVEAVAAEILASEPRALIRQALVKATTKDYVRRSQERLIARPLLERLRGDLGSAEAIEQRLLALLAHWRGCPSSDQGYGPGNAVNLLRLLRGDLRGLDLSRLTLRQVYLHGVEAHDASLALTHLADTALSDAFTLPDAVALSADGRFLAAGTATGEVRLWRLADRTLLMATPGHAGPVTNVALSADGQRVASGGDDGTIKLWDTASGRLLTTLRGHAGGIWSVALSADGRCVASGGEDGTARMWDVADGRQVLCVQGRTGPVYGVALSGDGRLLASGSQDGSVTLWEALGGRPVATLHGHDSGVVKVALSADGALLASAGHDGRVALWEATSARLVRTFEGHSGAVYGVSLSGDGTLLASAGYDGTVKLWEAGGRLLTTLRGHAGGVYDAALSADGRLVASGSFDGTLKLWEAASGQLLATLQGHRGEILDVALSAEGGVVAASGQDGALRLWEAANGRLLATLRGHAGPVYGISLSADGRLAVSGGYDGTVRLWDVTSGQSLATWREHGSGVYAVALSGDGRLAVSGSEDGTALLWDVMSGRPVAALRGHTGVIFGVALSGDGQRVASAGLDRTVRVWEAAGGQALAALPGHTGMVMGVALDRDGRMAASGSLDGTIRLWEVASGRELGILEGHGGGVASVALSGDGLSVISGGFDGTVRLSETRGGQALATLEEHTGLVHAVALSADGRLASSGGFDGTVRLWDATSGACLRTLRPDRPYERMDVTGLTGVTAAQRAALRALGAVEQEQAPVGAADSPPAASAATSLPQPAPPVEPAARTPTGTPTNLLPARTSFVGRAGEVGALARSLDPTIDAGARLLTLTGVAGSGKTRLALVVADAARDAYPDGVWLVELVSLTASSAPDHSAVVAATLSALGLHEQPGQTPLDTLVAFLRDRRLLLVLDNCEHVAAACAALTSRLLDACAGLHILTTSQRPLGVATEAVWPVAALMVPQDVEGAPTPEALQVMGQSDAVRLFVERARAVQPGFALSARNAGTVVAICRALDGLPLALELAAARLHVLTADDLLTRLGDRFALLRRGGRLLADRHQALQATLDWSYGLLDPAEQALLRRLAVFANGWDVAAAEAVCAGDDDLVAAETVLELLDELLERSLVYVSEAEGIPRYGVLETVRQYSVQQLERTGETAALRERHLHWAVTLAEQAAPALLGGEPAAWLARLEREQDNLRAALQWALDHSRSALGLRLAAGLWPFWRAHRTHLREGRRWLTAFLALPIDGDDAASLGARALALEGAAWLAEDEHDFVQASALFAQGAALPQADGQEEASAGQRINAAMEARARGDYARAAALLEETLAQHRGRGNRESIKRGGLGLTLSRLALVRGEQGRHAQATALYDECLALHRDLSDREGIGYARLGLGDMARDLGETARVRVYCEECLALFQELGHPLAGFALNNLALAAYLDGDLALAARRAEESVALFRELRAEPSLGEALVTLGRVRGAQGAASPARADLTEALTLAWAKGPRLVVAAALEGLGVLAVQQGESRQATHLLAVAARLRQEMGTPERPADRPEVEGARAAARAMLGETPFAEAWAAGQVPPIEQSIAHVVAGPENTATVAE